MMFRFIFAAMFTFASMQAFAEIKSTSKTKTKKVSTKSAAVETESTMVEAPSAEPVAKPAMKPMRSRRNKPMAKKMEEKQSKFVLSSFQLAGLFVTQAEDRETQSVMASWTPSYWVSDEFAVRANLGISSFKGEDDDSFLVYDAQVLLRYVLMIDWDIEAGGGVQVWQDNGGSNPIITGTFGWNPDNKMGTIVDRVFVGFSRYSGSNKANEANEVLVGVGLLF